MKSPKLHRRTLLRGAAGVTVALPVLDCMLNGNGTAYAQGQTIPRRYAIVFAGQALGGDDHEHNRSRVNGQLVTREAARDRWRIVAQLRVVVRAIEHQREAIGRTHGCGQFSAGYLRFAAIVVRTHGADRAVERAEDQDVGDDMQPTQSG